MALKKHITLIIGLSIPILMIALIALSIYIPGLFINPKYNFVYSTGGYYYKSKFTVSNNQIITREIKYPKHYQQRGEEHLFLYNVKTNQAKEITFEEAQQLKLDPKKISPDGYSVIRARGGRGLFPLFIFSSRDYRARYISGHNASRKLNIQYIGNAYYFHFIAWIINGQTTTP